MSHGQCRVCTGALSADHLGLLCVACASGAGFRRLLPRHFFDSPRLRQALAEHDFATVFNAIRQYTGLAQTQLADLVGLSQTRVADIENRRRRLRGLEVAIRIATAFSIPAHYFGFGVATGKTPVGVRPADRADWLTALMSASLGSDVDAELGHIDDFATGQRIVPLLRAKIGLREIEAIEGLSRYWRGADLAHGGALYRDAGLAQLHAVRALHSADCGEALRPRLWVAIAELAWVCGHLSFDCEDHATTRRLWVYASSAARRGAEDPRSADLSATINLDAARQALHLWRPMWTPTPEQRQHQNNTVIEGMRCAHLAAVTASTRTVSAVTEASIAAVTASCEAARGNVAATERLLRESAQRYSRADRTDLPLWSSLADDADAAAQHGHARYVLSLRDRDHAPRAVDLLTAAVDGYRIEDARSRTLALIALAGAQLQAGDHDAADRTCDTAITHLTTLASRRCYTILEDLDRIAAHHEQDSRIIGLRVRITAALGDMVDHRPPGTAATPPPSAPR